ncbi:hypothetical protein BH10ACI1_BH10ACI1_12330 [soil metagenome]
MAKHLTADSYSLLLRAFSADEKSAVAAYTKLRASLVRFFQIKGDVAPEESADETIERVAAKLGETVQIEDLTKYSFGTARLVFLENLRKSQKQKKAFEDFRWANELQKNDEEADDFAPFRECFESLPDAEKNILQKYFEDLPYAKLNENRQKLTGKLGVSVNNLRLKIFRMRRRLEDCVRGK